MFIISWLVILVLRANHIIVPALVSHIVGWLAIVEIAVYAVGILFGLLALILSVMDR